MPWRTPTNVELRLRRWASRPQLKRDPLGSGATYSMRPLDRRSVVASLGVAAIVAMVAWLYARTERSDSLAITVCAQLYAKAATRADTIRIDGQVPLQREESQLNPLTCSALRSAYPKRFVRPSP